MNLLLIRHAAAEDRDAFAATGAPDEDRPLTDRGSRRMRAAARGLVTLVPRIDLLATSPWLRARETAEIVGRACRPRISTPVVTDLLVPGAEYDALRRWLAAEPGAKVVALVGHEPHVSHLLGWVLTGSASRELTCFKKGAVASLQLDPTLPPGHSTLDWFLTPRQLRALDPKGN